MSGYVNNSINLNGNEFSSLFKRLYHFIKDKFQKETDELTFEELVETYSNDKNFLDYLDCIKTSLNNIAEIMRNLKFQHDEYYNFMSITNMITYIISDVGKYIKYSSFILTILNDFNNLIDSQNNSNYNIIYEKFDIKLESPYNYEK